MMEETAGAGVGVREGRSEMLGEVKVKEGRERRRRFEMLEREQVKERDVKEGSRSEMSEGEKVEEGEVRYWIERRWRKELRVQTDDEGNSCQSSEEMKRQDI
ncbi:hypothetical protein Pcinc_043635 [Petrolisthes cinctipes]|uniref:Uncharacterized protein n=1 Tax=Petrolisthes cinctipes TaxID=88211 RepID=A0AAE1BFK2_PETCI|nr:hypothetical protein Pcinc_043635 [Petrolisthes cinctipes]